MNDKIPKEVYAMTGMEPRLMRSETGELKKKLYITSRPSVDMSDLKLTEELGWEDEVTQEQILESEDRLHKQTKEAAWKFLKELTGR